MPHRVAITAMGCVSPLGAGSAKTIASLRASRDCIAPVTLFDVSETRCKTAGQVSDEVLARAEALHPHAKKLSRPSRMMVLALQEAISGQSGFVPERIVIGTTSGGMSFGETFYRSFASGTSRRHALRWIKEYVPQQPVLDAIRPLGWRAPYQIVSNACASGTNAIGNAFQLIRSGSCRGIVCGGYDALSELVFHGFDCLQASTPEKCRPFDVARTGLVLGEGAAIFFLEEWEHALRNRRQILAEIIGYGSATDNHHLTQPNPDGSGPRRAMLSALASAQISPDEVQYINAHGTATLFNDASEARAIMDVCPYAKVSSTKSMMGHSLGAAGSIETAFCIHALREGFLPANINFQEGDPAVPVSIIANSIQEQPPRIALSNSFGFGGSNASILLRRAA